LLQCKCKCGHQIPEQPNIVHQTPVSLQTGRPIPQVFRKMNFIGLFKFVLRVLMSNYCSLFQWTLIITLTDCTKLINVNILGASPKMLRYNYIIFCGTENQN